MSVLIVHASSRDSEPMVHIEALRKDFTGRLKDALAENGVAMWGAGVRLAKIAGVTPKATNKWLNGESMPSRAKMLAIAEWLGVSVEWLEYGEGPKKPGYSKQQPDNVQVSETLDALYALRGKVTPRSRKALDSIEKAANEGRLAEDDVLLLERIAKRFESTHPQD